MELRDALSVNPYRAKHYMVWELAKDADHGNLCQGQQDRHWERRRDPFYEIQAQ